MKIALDAMGGDYAPEATIQGAVWAARDFGIQVELVGQPQVIEAELKKHDTSSLSLSMASASQVVRMDEDPAAAVKSKPDSSMVVGAQMLKRGEVDAFVTAGHTGGGLAAALLHIGRIPGIKRPALCTAYPVSSEAGLCIVLDIGASPDCRPDYLYQYALMGSVYSEATLGVSNPRVAVLSNGEEEGKGSRLVKDALPLLNQGPFNFIGNVEGKDVPAGLADVVVTDGFTGNVFLKTSEGVAKLLVDAIKSGVAGGSLPVKLGALLARPALQSAATKLDYREFGGATLLGVDGIVVIAHGRSRGYAVRNAVRLSVRCVSGDVLGTIKSRLKTARTQAED